MTSQGRSLELFFVDGRPDGMLTAEVFANLQAITP